jgi:hypothetical protein
MWGDLPYVMQPVSYMANIGGQIYFIHMPLSLND